MRHRRQRLEQEQRLLRTSREEPPPARALDDRVIVARRVVPEQREGEAAPALRLAVAAAAVAAGLRQDRHDVPGEPRRRPLLTPYDLDRHRYRGASPLDLDPGPAARQWMNDAVRTDLDHSRIGRAIAHPPRRIRLSPTGERLGDEELLPGVPTDEHNRLGNYRETWRGRCRVAGGYGPGARPEEPEPGHDGGKQRESCTIMRRSQHRGRTQSRQAKGREFAGGSDAR